MTKILQLKARVMGIKPMIWRQLLVEDKITFQKLHEILQIAIGWDDYHLYNFEVGDFSIERDSEEGPFVDADWGGSQKKALLADKTSLNKLIKGEKQKFAYTYDFGDNWVIGVVVEKITDNSPAQQHPLCIGGKRAGPPEDCGGVWGYMDLVNLKKDKENPLYKERIADWLGEDFDFEEFDITGVNKKLARLK